MSPNGRNHLAERFGSQARSVLLNGVTRFVGAHEDRGCREACDLFLQLHPHRLEVGWGARETVRQQDERPRAKIRGGRKLRPGGRQVVGVGKARPPKEIDGGLTGWVQKRIPRKADRRPVHPDETSHLGGVTLRVQAVEEAAQRPTPRT